MITEGEAEAEILCVSWIGGLVTHFNPLRFHHLEGTGDKLTWQRKYLPIYSWKSPLAPTQLCVGGFLLQFSGTMVLLLCCICTYCL